MKGLEDATACVAKNVIGVRFKPPHYEPEAETDESPDEKSERGN